MKKRHEFGAGLLLLSLAGLVGCSGADGSSPTSPSTPAVFERDTTATADVDPVAGTIILPIEKYLLSQPETDELMNIRGLAMSLCAAEEGVEVPWERRQPRAETSRRYGVWKLDEVQHYGYSLPGLTEADPPSGDTYTDADLAVFDKCNTQDADVKALSFEHIRPSFDYAQLSGTSAAAQETDDAKAAFAEWEQCLSSSGLERDVDVSPYAVKGATLDITEANLRVAVADVNCKTQVGFIQRLADIEASMQAPIVARYEKELTQMRAEYEEVLARARAYLETHAS